MGGGHGTGAGRGGNGAGAGDGDGGGCTRLDSESMCDAAKDPDTGSRQCIFYDDEPVEQCVPNEHSRACFYTTKQECITNQDRTGSNCAWLVIAQTL